MFSQFFELQCPSRIKIFVEFMCGSPADLRKFQPLHTALSSFYTNPDEFDWHEMDKKNHSYLKRSNDWEKVKIIIPCRWREADDVEIFSSKNLNFLVYLADSILKTRLMLFLQLAIFYGFELKEAILLFRKVYGLDESSWKFDAMRKYYDRHSDEELPEIKEIKLGMIQIFMQNLQRIGYVTPQFIEKCGFVPLFILDK